MDEKTQGFDPDSVPEQFVNHALVSARTRPAPLPSEIPPAPDLSSLPLPILHSGTVETLIGQNEDLMARLKVNIRRNSVLEQQIMNHERLSVELSQINNGLTTQMQVLQEKDRMWREKAAQNEKKIEILRESLSDLQSQTRKLLSSHIFRRRVNRWVRPMIDRLKANFTEERQARLSRDAQLSDLKARFTEAVAHAREIENRMVKDQVTLVEQYEKKQKELQAEIDKVRSEAKIHRDKSNRFDELVALRAELENKNIALERKTQELAKQVAHSENKTREIAVEGVNRDRQLIDALADLEESRGELLRVKDQIETLQMAWGDSQQKLDSAKLQIENLNRLNQDLSRQLKESRLNSDRPAAQLDC